MESLRNRQVKWHEVERPAEYNDRVTVDLKLIVEEKSISDLKDNTFELTNERYGLFSGMDEHIIGMTVGESKEFTTVIPADYSNDKIAGKEGQYTVTLYKVEFKEVPELDDALASIVSNDQYNNLEDLRKAISDNILESKKRRIRDELREKVVNAVIEQSQFTIHPLLLKEEADEMMHQLSHLLEQQRMSMDQYLMMIRKTKEEYLKDLQPDAEKRVKRELVLDEVAKKEQIVIIPEEIEALFQAYAQAGQQLERSEAQVRTLVVNYRREKAITRLLELTTDPDPDAEEDGAEEETSIENAEAAALAGGDTVTEAVESEEPELARDEITATAEVVTPATTDSNADVVE